MALFHHPCLVRGVVHTGRGAFVISRGIVNLPDDLGESWGWTPVEAPEETPRTSWPPSRAQDLDAGTAASGPRR
jgi:hypothetical protein